MLNNLIAECTDYDFKENLEANKPKSWLKSVSAFANGSGGTLFFGVNDDGKAIGLNNPKIIADKISELINAKISPVPSYALVPVSENGKNVLLVTVNPGLSSPYYYKSDGVCQAYVRLGNESVEAPIYMLNELILKGTGKTYDGIVTGYMPDDFSFSILKSTFFERTGTKFTDSDFKSFGLVSEKGFLTNAGLLMADSNPYRHSRVFCTRWNGLDKISEQEVLDDKEFSGSLIKQLKEAMSFFRTNTKISWHKEKDGTVYKQEYDEEAIMEALVNGIIHRDYNNLGSEVCLNIYNDRIEISSPGGTFNGRKIPECVTTTLESTRRNPIIADLFWRMKYMNRRGSGLANITSKTNALFNDGKNHVKYDVTPYSFIVLIDNSNALKTNLSENENDTRLINFLREHDGASIQFVSFSLNMPKSTIGFKIRKLKEKGLIENKGTTRKNKWLVHD